MNKQEFLENIESIKKSLVFNSESNFKEQLLNTDLLQKLEGFIQKINSLITEFNNPTDPEIIEDHDIILKFLNLINTVRFLKAYIAKLNDVSTKLPEIINYDSVNEALKNTGKTVKEENEIINKCKIINTLTSLINKPELITIEIKKFNKFVKDIEESKYRPSLIKKHYIEIKDQYIRLKSLILYYNDITEKEDKRISIDSVSNIKFIKSYLDKNRKVIKDLKDLPSDLILD